MKKCKQCKITKPIEDFYKCRGGVFGKCKQCVRLNVTENRNKNIEKYREYDRNRGNRHKSGYLKEFRAKYPNKYKAQNMVNNAIRDGKLFKEPCSECGTEKNPHAHHDDYLKPLNVRWLCAACHSQWHRDNGEGLNASNHQTNNNVR